MMAEFLIVKVRSTRRSFWKPVKNRENIKVMACCARSPSADALEDWEEWDASETPFITHAVAGSLAGAAEHCLVFPLDTIKTFAQTSTSNSLKNILQSPTCGKKTTTKSFFRLWRGVSSMLTACVPAHAFYFSIYEQGKAMNKSESVFFSGLTGMAATTGHDLIMCPMDLIKQRLQLGFHSGIFDCAKNVLKHEGLATFYLSLPTTLIMNMPYAGISVAVNDSVKRIVNPQNEYNVPAFMFAGATAGATAALVTTPLDVIKTRIQTQNLASKLDMSASKCSETVSGNSRTFSSYRNPRLDFMKQKVNGVNVGIQGMARVSHTTSSEKPQQPQKKCLYKNSLDTRKYSGLVDAVKKIFAEEGFKGFSRGAAARMAVHTPSVAISWTTYESAKKLFGYI